MRAAEVAEVSDQQIDTAIQHGHLDILLAKTYKPHTQADALSRLQVERIHVFAVQLAGGLRSNNWVQFLNMNLQPAVEHFRLNLKSFRVGCA